MNKLKPIDLSKITMVDFPQDQYFAEETSKNQITIHHTVSGPTGKFSGAEGDINSWTSDSARIATHFIITRDGKVWQFFSSKYWGHHIGVKSDFLTKQGFKDAATRNVLLNKASISIEIDSWGILTKNADGTFNSCYGKPISKDIQVQEYPNKFRGGQYFEKYTDAQIQSTGELILFLSQKYNIPLNYNSDMWDVSKSALSGKAGIYTHVSYRNDKSDAAPQPELINMLKSLNL